MTLEPEDLINFLSEMDQLFLKYLYDGDLATKYYLTAFFASGRSLRIFELFPCKWEILIAANKARETVDIKNDDELRAARDAFLNDILEITRSHVKEALGVYNDQLKNEREANDKSAN